MTRWRLRGGGVAGLTFECFLFCMVIASNACLGAETGPESSILSSDPTGINVSLQGPAKLSGNTPLDLQDLPIGEYQLHARKPGLPFVRGRLLRMDQGFEQRPWAGSTALLLPPGILHVSRGERRGWVFLGGFALSASMAVTTHGRMSDAEDDRSRASQDLASAVSEDEIRNAWFSSEIATAAVKDHRESRNLWIIYSGATVLGAFLEAVVLTPGPNLRAQADGGYLISPPPTGRFRNSLRSALIPGSGQRFMGEERRANLFAAGVGSLAAGTIFAYSEFLDARTSQADAQRRYLSADTEEGIRRTRDALQDAARRTDRMEILSWSLASAAGVIYLWNVLDASGSGHRGGRVPVELSWNPDHEQFRVTATLGGR